MQTYWPIPTASGGDIIITGCPNDQNVAAPEGTLFFQATWDVPTAVDSNGVPLTPEASHNPPRFFNVPSSTEITYTFTDQAGNTAECRFTYTISE